MICNRCKNATDDGAAYHDDCWAEQKRDWDEHDRRIQAEALDAIQRIKAGEQVRVSAACMARFGRYLDYWRQAPGNKAKRKIEL
jgi:hypothetical protein